MEKFQLMVKEEMDLVYQQPTYTRPNVPSKEEILLSASLIAEEFEETLQGLGITIENIINNNSEGSFDPVATADGIGDMIVVLMGLANRCGFDMEPIMHEIHRSNMSKQGGIKREDGKWQKPDTYSEANIKQCLIDQGWSL